MAIKLVAYDWLLRPVWLQEVSLRDGVRSKTPRLRKFLLIEDTGELVLVVGPRFSWPMEYHHFLLRDKYKQRYGMQGRCLGGGVLSAERNCDAGYQAQLAFWKNFVCGTYNDDLAGLENMLNIMLKCQVKITVE